MEIIKIALYLYYNLNISINNFIRHIKVHNFLFFYSGPLPFIDGLYFELPF